MRIVNLTKLIVFLYYRLHYLLINKCVYLKIYTTYNIKKLNVCITYMVIKENKEYSFKCYTTHIKPVPNVKYSCTEIVRNNELYI